MKKFFLGALMALALMPFVGDASVYVRGYTRKDGTYVQPHYRSNPDGNPYNNWSFPGNTNPYTGETATGDPNTYLNNYYGGGSSGSSLPSYTVPVSTPVPSASPTLYGYTGKNHHNISSTVKNWVDSNPQTACLISFTSAEFEECISYKYLRNMYEWDVQYPVQEQNTDAAIIEALTKQVLALQSQLAALVQQQSNK